LGQKRFSLEGAESFMPLLDTIAETTSVLGVGEITIGMAHRGRLGTLCNFIGKSYEQMFKKFEGTEFNQYQIDGDVKYHLGYASERVFQGSKIKLILMPNPSHLEIVNPVVEGFVRARQELTKDTNRKQVLPLLVHGDAAFMGQGLVAETLNLAELQGYKTGGTIHVIINNQVGFTTDPSDSRSCRYASGIAKILKAPVLHVNADDPEAVVWCGVLASEYRQKFGKDIKQIPIILVGNKVDCVNVIHRDQIEKEWIETNKAKVYVEASALKNTGIDEVFQAAGFQAQEYQNSLRSAISEAFNHSIINI
jgi:2-oxoglutarate dehydrogenase E1 component